MSSFINIFIKNLFSSILIDMESLFFFFDFSVGSAIVGRVSDHIVIKWRRQRKGIWYPEDRMRAAVIPYAIFIPISVLCFGLANRFIEGKMGLGLSLVFLFFSGGGVSEQKRVFLHTFFDLMIYLLR